MSVTIRIEGTRDKASTQFTGLRETDSYTVIDCDGMEFTQGLTASFLRAVADEVDGGAR